MRVKRAAVFIILAAAAVIYAQDVAEIFKELTTKTVSEPVPVAPAPVQEAVPGITVSQPLPTEAGTAPAVKTVSLPVAAEPDRREPPVEPAPAAVVVAETNSAVAVKPAAVPEGDVQSVTVAPELAGQGSMKGELISLSLKEVELSSVIRLFATLSDANIIVPALEDKTGSVKVDVNLKNVEWKPALQSILDANNLELYEKSPGSEVYSVRKKPADAPLAMNIKIFKLDYASVSNVNEMIKTMIPQTGAAAGKISVFPARNTIIVQSTPENLMDIQAMITAVDLPRQQVFIEAKFMELTDSASEKLGIDWQVLGGYGIGINGINGGYSNSNVFTENRYTDIAGRPYENATIAAPADPLARPGSNPLTDTRVFGITPTTQESGVISKTLGATLSASDFNLVLAALKDINGVKIVSNPKVVVANEETATIHIGTREPNIRIDRQAGTTDNPGGSLTVSLDPDVKYFEDGVKVVVTPTINTASNISVVIEPELTTFTGRKSVEQDGYTLIDYPISSTKRVNTVFSLASGQTAAIGGLTKASEDDQERKVPVLGSIPLLGRLFSYSSKELTQDETIVFVTVSLANPDNIDMETGLPQDSTLAMRYEAKSRSDRQIKAEERKVLEQHESERSQKAIQKLRDVEQKRLEKEK